jgi:hypothetical protein
VTSGSDAIASLRRRSERRGSITDDRTIAAIGGWVAAIIAGLVFRMGAIVAGTLMGAVAGFILDLWLADHR